MPERASTDQDIADCFDVIAELRPHLTRDAFVALVRDMEAGGYRLACIRNGDRVVAVAGYRISTNLVFGRNLYVDDLVTAETERSRGHGRALLDWLRDVAILNGCRRLHLDSGIQRKRAHEFYLREGLEISSYHFQQEVGKP